MNTKIRAVLELIPYSNRYEIKPVFLLNSNIHLNIGQINVYISRPTGLSATTTKTTEEFHRLLESASD